jgi:uncharacterized protein (DUF305 family)
LKSITAAVLAATAACATGTGAPQPPSTAGTPTPAEAAHQHDHTPALPASAGPGFAVADVRFMQNMIGHHAQAILMAGLAPSHDASENVLKLAQKIDISQRDEIAFMKQWLTERNQAVPDSTQAHAMMMPGMLTPAQLVQLEAARGREFDRLFLDFMIRHHEGALQMVEELFRTPNAAQDSDIFRFVTDVDADQRDEILVMEKLLATIGEEPR